ncbi:MAG: DUF5618 family protein [Chitinivibrionia bacterium]|nr:DUF5618 family protein [Chitinivibrionia bacterium]
MSIEEQQAFLKKWYDEALRYMDNAEETLKKAKKDERNYADAKYVRTACGIAYNGVLIALDALFEIKGIEKKLGKKQRKSIEYYKANLANHDKKLLTELHSAYNVLHLDGYYDGILNAKTIAGGFEAAYEIINKIKPMQTK